MHFRDIILPPVDVVAALIDSYFDGVHWYMLVLHDEGSFRERVKWVVAMDPRVRSSSNTNFLVLHFPKTYISALDVISVKAQFPLTPIRYNCCINVLLFYNLGYVKFYKSL